MARPFSHDHDHYVAKNRALASWSENDARNRKFAEKENASQERKPSCFNCKLRRKCTAFKGKRVGSTSGVVSFGGGPESSLCDKFVAEPAESRQMNDRQIKSLMKNFRRAR